MSVRTGNDGVPPKVIKWAPHLFGPILLIIFNKCLQTGQYPDSMKIAKVSPIHKNGDKNILDNYRPISVLTQFNRLFERLLAKRLMNFFDKNNIITKQQFGFLKKHSTEHAILDLKEYILKKFEDHEIVAVLYLDLQKAFDTVGHDILLRKLYHYGIRGKTHDLLKSYLSNRKQFSTIGKSASELANVLWGVPQGSVLGPLLFLIFINDLPRSSSLYTWLFADDTALALSSKCPRELEKRFNLEVNKVQDWLLANGLSVHYSKKTQYMLLKGRGLRTEIHAGFKLSMGGHQIERTDTYKYLGLLFDDKLNWKCQIDKLCSKLASVCGILSKVRHYLNRKSLLLIYYSLFESRLRYGSLGWGTAAECDIKRLKVLQNRAIRFIDFASFRTPMLPIYHKLGVLPLEHQFRLQRATFMYNLHFTNLPLVLSNYCKPPTHRYPTSYSTSLNYVLPFVKTNRAQTSIKFAGPKVWATVPYDLKTIGNRKKFTSGLKDHFLSIIKDSLPLVTRSSKKSSQTTLSTELKRLFEVDNVDTEFYGFSQDLEDLFQSDNEDEKTEFFGFIMPTENVNLSLLFQNDSDDDEFLGFQ